MEDPAVTWPDIAADFAGPVVVRARVEPVGEGGAHVLGTVRVPIEVRCRRCLEEGRQTLSLELDLLYRVGAAEAEDRLWPLDSGTDEIDLGPALREEILLSLPEYPLCRSDCPGLCPVCGARLENGDCGCSRVETDARWDALRALREG